MIRLLVLCLSLIGLTILLTSAVLTFLAADEEVVVQTGETAASKRSARSEQAAESRPNPLRPVPGLGQSTAVDITTVTAELSGLVSLAIDDQVATRLGEFIDNLSGDDERRDIVRQALAEAYAKAATSTATQNLTAGSIRDSNFIVNSLEAVLDSNELTQLESYLEDSSREAFLQTYSPQLELVSPQLNADDKQFLLDTLFTETYAATSPDGNATGQTSDFIAAQLEAIRLTRDSIKGALSEAEFELANEFLSEQEAGLKTAMDIFGSNPK